MSSSSVDQPSAAAAQNIPPMPPGSPPWPPLEPQPANTPPLPPPVGYPPTYGYPPTQPYPSQQPIGYPPSYGYPPVAPRGNGCLIATAIIIIGFCMVLFAGGIAYAVIQHFSGDDSKPDNSRTRFDRVVSTMMVGEEGAKDAVYCEKLFTGAAGILAGDGAAKPPMIDQRREFVAVISKLGQFSVTGNELGRRYPGFPALMADAISEVLPQNEKNETLDGEFTTTDRANAVRVLQELADAFKKVQ